MARRNYHPKPRWPAVGGFVAIALIVTTGIHYLSYSSASGVNPYGTADYCHLEGNNTVIYGWANEPNATALSQPSVSVDVGGKVITAPSDRAGYRDQDINYYIDQYHKGDPKPGTYGWQAQFNELYKGTKYSISGTVINVGPGANSSLSINNQTNIDHNAALPYFAGNVIPDICLANRPAPPPPPPPPPPAPKPTPKPSPPTAPSTPASPDISAAADGSVTAGTAAADLKVPAGNAVSLHIAYGTNPVVLDMKTADQPTNGTDTTVRLTGLSPSTMYSYQIIRNGDGGKTVTTPAATFITKGFTVALHFSNNQAHGVKGIEGEISSLQLKSSSDDNGLMSFADVPNGSYTITFKYQGKSYRQAITTDVSKLSQEDSTRTAEATMSFFVNVDKLVAATAPTHSSPLPRILVILVIIGLVVFTLVKLIRRRSATPAGYAFELPPLSQPVQQPPTLPVVPPDPPHLKPPRHPPPEMPEHMGQSLKDMVLSSMAKEAQKRRQATEDDTKPKPT